MARKDFGVKPAVYPHPVFIIGTYDEKGNPDLMNAAWGGVHDSDELFLCLSAGHKTVKNFQKTGAFTVSMGEAGCVKACDYVGMVSGNNVPDKVEKAGFTTTPSEKVNAPIINELAVCVECTVKSYDPSTGSLVGKIVNVSVDERVIRDGAVDVDVLRPITFDSFNNTYRVLGEVVGKAFHDGKE